MKKNKIGILLASIFALIAIVFSILIWGNYGYKYNEIYVKSDVNTFYVGKYKTAGLKEKNNSTSFKLSGLYKNEDIVTKFSGFSLDYRSNDEALLFYNNSIYVVTKNESNYNVLECITKENNNGNDYYLLDFEVITKYIDSFDDLTKIIDKTYDGSLYEIGENSIKIKGCFIKDGKKEWSDTYNYKLTYQNNNVIVEAV